MSAFVKSKLKSARDLIAKKDFTRARDAAADVLSYEPDNYNAHVFLGLASLETGDYDQSEQAYRNAIKSKPDQPLAWQGLCKFYEKKEQWDKYAETMYSMMELYAKSEESTKLAELLQKYIELWRQKGTRLQVIEALELLMPGSKFYPILSNLPPPDPTAPEATTTLPTQQAIYNSLPILEEIIALMESEETEKFRKEVDKRRTRIGYSGPEQVRKEVGLEIWSLSKLPALYSEIMNHPNTSDESRRQTESKLLRYKYNYLCALPTSGDKASIKKKLAAEVQDLISGMVLLNIPDELAWTLFIEGKDVTTIGGYDYPLLRKFASLFVAHPLTRFIRGYFGYYAIPLRDEVNEEEENEESEPEVEEAEEDPYNIVVDAIDKLPNSLLAHHGLGDIYLSEEDYQNAISVGEKGLELVRSRENDFGKRLTKVRISFNTILATGLVHLFPPKHHIRAIRILDDVLSEDPKNANCLMGRAYVLQKASKWLEASHLFETVQTILPEDLDDNLVAREEHAWCLVQLERFDEAATELEAVKADVEELEGYDFRKARVWWRLGTCYWKSGEDSKVEEAYRCFITSLKRYPNFAPAFTSLGIYYAEYALVPDLTRATKCFQKAFELDARETEAAKRLADSFAEEREWDLVEVVVRRAIEGEGGLTGGLGDPDTSAIAKLKPTNAWAWKTLGIVELNQRHYPAAIQAFQVALRSDENDSLSWLRLGEAYAKAGRHAASLKALDKSLQLDPENWLCKYELGDVYGQTGQLTQAISIFEEILLSRPHEPVVLHSLANSHLSLGRVERNTGFLGRSFNSFLNAINVCLQMMSEDSFRRLAWKAIGDSLLGLSEFASFPDPDLATNVFNNLYKYRLSSAESQLSGIVHLPSLHNSPIANGLVALSFAVLAYSSRLMLFVKDEEGFGSASFDFGVALHRLASSASSNDVRSRASLASIQAVQNALVKDSSNALYWNVFGILHFVTDSKVAQHAFIRALEINSKDVSVWTNLGFLYLHNNDTDLANEAFYRAQTLDPDHTLAWVGQGLVAISNGHQSDANALFAHATGLSSESPDADLKYSWLMFHEVPSASRGSEQMTRELSLPSFFCLDRYCRQRSEDASALHLFGLVCERLRHYDLSISYLSRAIKILEASYEETEDIEIERRYAIANANLGRLLLATDNYETAIETFESAYGLLSGSTDPERVDKETIAVQVMCQIGCGLAHSRIGNAAEAVSFFESVLELSNPVPLLRGHVTVLLAKTLWELGSQDGQESAKSQLLDCINSDPDNLPAIVALAAMGLLTNDDDLIDAALSEIVTLPLQQRYDCDPERHVSHLLIKHSIAEKNAEHAVAVAQKDVHSDPSRDISRLALATLEIQLKHPSISQALLSDIHDIEDAKHPEGVADSLRLLATAIALVGREQDRPLRLAEKATHLSPWDRKNWLCLSYVIQASR